MTGNGAAGGPPGEAINDRIRSLERKWNLGLRIRGEGWSPTTKNPSDLADKTFGLVKRLFYLPPALDKAIENFEGLARQWPRNKPRNERLEELYRTLQNEVKKHTPAPKNATPRNNPPKSLLASSLHVNYLQEAPTKADPETIAKDTPQSTNRLLDFRQEERESYTTAVDPGSPTDVDTEDEGNEPFETPRSPSPSTSRSQKIFQASKHVSLKITRKRPSESSDHFENSSKLTKTSKGKQAVKSLMTSSIAQPEFKKPTLNMARSSQGIASFSSSANPSFVNTTFSSQETTKTTETSFTSHESDNDADERRTMGSKLKRTSSTTMGSLDDYELIRAESRLGLFEQDIQNDLNEVFSQGSSGQSRSTFGSIDEDGLCEVSLKVEANEAKLASPSATTREPEVPGISDNGGYHKTPLKTGLPPTKPQKDRNYPPNPADSPSKMPYEVRDLSRQNLFVATLSDRFRRFPYHILYICQRIATEASISPEDLLCNMNVSAVRTSQEEFWKCIEKHSRVPHVKLRESSRLWQASKNRYDGYTFKGSLTFNPKSDGPLLSLRLSSVQADNSCRLQRIFGSDRFLYLNSPLFRSARVDSRHDTATMDQIRKQWQAWLLTEHSFLGRKWRVFHIEDLKKGKNTRRKDVMHDKRLVLFATEGWGIEKPCSIGQMLNQFLPFASNADQSVCKAFARIDLGLSRTIPTLCFEPGQIIRVKDKLATLDFEDTRFNDISLHWPPFPDGTVMDDGCSIISVGAALIIWQLYKKATGTTGPLPSIFQGRIAGAKGVWIISAESYTKDPEHLKPWIMINASQWKFNPPEDALLDHEHHRTFELSNYSSSPTPSELHISFIPILVDRKVPLTVIDSLMKDSLEAERTKLLDLLPDPVKMYDWVHRNGTKTQSGNDVPWQAAMPVSLEEKVKLLLESGFSPAKFQPLAQSLQRFIQAKQILQESKLRVPLAKSTFLFGIVDPFEVLEPGQIQVQFSSSFADDTTDEKYLGLRDMEVLVARQPACRRSDIQKVRTVIRPELSHLVDVVVFPSRGRYPLAGKLQGGDYDGDIFWICWEPQLVLPFLNAPAPVQSPDPARYEIKKTTAKVRDVIDTRNPGDVDRLLEMAIEARSKSSMLGMVTVFAEKQAYRENCIHSATLEALYDMHDLLVDAPKQGYFLSQADFDLCKQKLGLKEPKQPAYKCAMEDCANAKNSTKVEECRKRNYSPKLNRVIDYLYFETVRKHNVETMRLVNEFFSKATPLDDTLLYPQKHLNDKNSKAIKKELRSYYEKLDSLYRDWNSGWHKDYDPERCNAHIDDCYRKYQAIQPDYPDDPEIRPLVEQYLGPGICYWDKVKASALYAKFPYKEKSSFVLTMAGGELARLKADSFPLTRALVSGIRTNLKPKPIKAPIQYDEEGEDDDEEEEFESALEEPLLE
ncbi:RNA-directed RNA polymerase 2 [Pyrenophora tritici-repentis]|nr:TopA, Topoisomerase IA [Pyrenophora tritici-repentis]PZD00401.1 RNA-directed RNA polymerase 2 [Pyrenophora tritici-repentis]PZD32523.1 RNA-directed RNA polymerase 2 [Pyrenophora tritici-repentis]